MLTMLTSQKILIGTFYPNYNHKIMTKEEKQLIIITLLSSWGDLKASLNKLK